MSSSFRRARALFKFTKSRLMPAILKPNATDPVYMMVNKESHEQQKHLKGLVSVCLEMILTFWKQIFNCSFLHLKPSVNIFMSMLIFLFVCLILKLKEYNESQQSVILDASSIISSNDSKLFFLQGPPGTGKSHTIVGIINAMFYVII